jgi:hypothetical protein
MARPHIPKLARQRPKGRSRSTNPRLPPTISTKMKAAMDSPIAMTSGAIPAYQGNQLKTKVRVKKIKT